MPARSSGDADAVWADGSAFPWAITVDGRLIGMIELRPADHRAEIGYAISRATWGHGYTTEAARAVVDWALTQPSIRRVWAYVDVENAPSARVLEKTGMTREGLVRAWYVPPAFGVPRDCWMYGRVKAASAPVVAPRATFAAAVAAEPAPVTTPRARPARLETKRLVLRRPTVGDAEAIFTAYAQDPEVSRYTTWAPHHRIEDTRGFLRACEDGWARGTVLSWAITRREDGRLIGTTDIRLDGHRGEIGYVLARSAWRQGYASEAASAVVAWGLAQPELHRVWAVCDVENPASARVMEKAGMTREGLPPRVGRDARLSRPARRLVLCRGEGANVSRFDAVTLEVLWTRIISIVDEAAKAIVRTSFSTLSNEANDFACVLTDARGPRPRAEQRQHPVVHRHPARDRAPLPARARPGRASSPATC